MDRPVGLGASNEPVDDIEDERRGGNPQSRVVHFDRSGETTDPEMKWECIDQAPRTPGPESVPTET